MTGKTLITSQTVPQKQDGLLLFNIIQKKAVCYQATFGVFVSGLFNGTQ